MAKPGPLTIDEALSAAKKAAKRGNVERAAQLFRAILELEPGHPVAKKGLRRLQRSGARRRTADASAAEPDPSEIDRAIASYRAGRFDEAHRACQALLEKFPRSVIVLNLLGSTYQASGEPERAIAAFDKAIGLDPDFADAYSNRANALRDLGRSEDAIADYGEAIRLRPANPVAYLNRGNAYREIGRFADAIESYEAAIRSHPGLAQAYRHLSDLQTFTAGDPRIDDMRSFVDDPATADTDRQEFCFALGKALDDIGDVDEAFQVFERGNALRRRQLGYDIERDRALFESIRDSYTAWSGDAERAVADRSTRRPIFIVGMPRSGTSLVEQILASHSDVCGAGELETANRILTPCFSPNAPTELPSPVDLRQTYLSSVERLGRGERFITDKMPLNFRWIGFLATAIPDARFVHVSRDPVATCWSNFRHYFPDEGIGYACSLTDLRQFYTLYLELMDFWRRRLPGVIYELDYERLTTNQRTETEQLLHHCELDWQDACLEFHRSERAVRTASAAQVRREIYSGSSEAWKRYERFLGPLLPLRARD